MTPPAGLDGPLPAARPRRTAGLAVLLALGAGGVLWAALAGLGPARVDGALLRESVDARTGDLTALATVVTHVGRPLVMGVLAAALGIVLWTRRRRADAVFVVGAMGGASALFGGLKELLGRARPPAPTRLVTETNESLPSGHAAVPIAVIGSLVVLGWVGRGVAGRVAMVAAAALWVGAVGLTRVYLGVHWFSDVVAGWLVGGAWLAVCVAVWSGWRRRAAAPERTLDRAR